MVKILIGRISAGALLASLICTVGCGSSTGPPADQASFEKRMGADANKQLAFIKELEATPPAGRKAFIDQHASEMRNIALIRDPDLQARYRKAMGAKG
jgi:hypothetical protein